jgi:hypothetical protein
MEYQNMYFISNSAGEITSYDVVDIPQNSNNIKLNFCGNYTATAIVKLAITQANGVTLPTRAVPKSLSTYTVGETTYSVYTYRMVQDDTKICPSETGTLKISFTVEDEGEEIVATQDIALTVVKTTSASVSNTPADTVDAIMAQQNQNTTKILELMADITQIDVEFDLKVDKTQKIAGVDLQDNITDTELKAALDIDNVDNTSDTNKPVSTAQAAAIAQAVADILGGETTYDTLKKITDLIGAANGIAPLDEDSKIPSTYLPSYVDDILEYDDLTGFPATGEGGKIYVAKDTNLTYRWSGTAYVEISKSLALGETSSTAFRGDYGKVLYDFAQTAIAGGLLKTQLDSKLNKTDKYTAPIDLEYDSTNKYWAWDYSDGDNALIEMSGSEPTTDINITNASEGDIGVVTVKGGQLTLPLNSVLSADFGYITAVGNQYYRYSFYFNGTTFEWHRTVLGEEDD